MDRKEKIVLVLSVLAAICSGALHFGGAGDVVTFVVSAITLALLAMIVGDATEQLGSRLGPGTTGILQASFGNLPELFVAIFALRAGLVAIVQAALIGSMLANSVLVLGLALFFGGLRNGTQRFKSEPPRMIITLMMLASAAIVIPTIVHELHTAADPHLEHLDVVVAIVLLVLLAASIYFSIKKDPSVALSQESTGGAEWPMGLAIGMLAGAGVAAAFISDWFVDALQPAMRTLGISDAFAGLVVVAVAGNAIENLVGIQLAWRNQADYAVSVILNSSLQIALGLFPLLVIISLVMGGAVLSFVLSPLLVAALVLAVIVCAFVVYDGESIWLEGLALIGLYCIIAAAFWWG